MAKRSKRLFPRRMGSDFINTSDGIDRYTYAELYTEHVKSLKRSEKLPETRLTNNGRVILTPRVEALAQAQVEGMATPTITSIETGQRMQKVSTWNYFRVAENLLLYFCRDQWVFVKTSKEVKGEVIFSVIYKSKDEALRAHDTKKIFWAGEKLIV